MLIYSLEILFEMIVSLWVGHNGEQHFHCSNYVSTYMSHNMAIYIIITKNIHYLLRNRGLWRSLNNIYPIFLTPCIGCTNHLRDSCDLTDVNPHFILSLLRMIQNVDLLWRHWYKSRSPAIVTSQWLIVPAWLLWTFLSTVMLRTVI